MNEPMPRPTWSMKLPYRMSSRQTEQRKTLIETFLDKHIVPQQYPHSYAIHNVKSRISGEDQPHCHLMFSLKADDGIERSAEQYFKRYNPQDPAKGGAKKIQLQDGHEDYSTFLIYIRKQWENHLNDALAQHCPTVTYTLDGQDITIKNQVSADSYEKYNEIHSTLYLPEPKLGVGQQNATAEYLAQIQKIREHNQQERELEERQKQLDQQHEYFYSAENNPFSSLEVMYYLNYLIKNATNKDKLKNDLNEIIKNQGPILKQEAWSIYEMNEKLEDSRRNSTPCFEFEVHSLPEYVLPIQNTPPKRTQSEPVQPKADDYDYGGPGF
ncbi:MobA/MobL family protein (plasmid) [Acinetobacter baumannii]|nr:MobA/MobL family protein [Acinetobacter baumannii]UQL81868.1 MobA/MobL family protein [Acinetobacter baumannii]